MKKTLIAAVLLTYSSFSQAMLIDNGSTTIDTSTNLEWLDVTATLGQSYNSVIGGFGGYIAAGYSVATTSQICGLFAALGDTILNCGTGGSQTDTISAASATEFIGKLGNTYSPRSGTFGWFDGGNISGGAVALGCVNADPPGCINSSTPYTVATLNPTWESRDTSISIVGGWLTRQAQVPEPSIIALFAAGLFGLGFARSRQT